MRFPLTPGWSGLAGAIALATDDTDRCPAGTVNVTAAVPSEADAAPPRYAIFADEAQHNVGRVRGVAAVSLRAQDTDRLSGEVAALLATSGVSECKWELVRSARQCFAAGKLLAWALDRALDGRLWIDALTWSTADEAARRQALPSLARLRQMYARLLDGVIQRRVTVGSRWSVYPDEQQALDWTKIAAQMAARDRIERIEPQRSHAAPLVQVADLFVGLGVCSRDAYDAYQRWRSFPDEERNVLAARFAPMAPLPASLRYRCALLDDFYTACVRRLPGISLRTRCGLYTYAPEAPIQFRWG